jgi:hypothetical protein
MSAKCQSGLLALFRQSGFPQAFLKPCEVGSKFVGFSDVAFGSKFGSRRTSYVRFPPDSDRESGFPRKVMSALGQ